MTDDLSLYIHSNSGYTSLVGSCLSTLVSSFPSSSSSSSSTHEELHITLLTKSEAALLRSQSKPNPFLAFSLSLAEIVPLGLGGSPKHEDVSFLVVLVNRTNFLRRKAGLPFKDFHVSLSTPAHSSPEDFPHGLSTLLAPLNFSPRTTLNTTQLDALSQHFLLSSDFPSSFSAALRLAHLSLSSSSSSCLSSSKALIRLADAALKLERYKTAMLAFGRAWEVAGVEEEGGEGKREKARIWAMRGMEKASRETEWGTVWYEREEEELEKLVDEGREGGKELRRVLLEPWGEELREAVRTRFGEMESPTFEVDAEESVVVRMENGENVRMRRNLRWIIPFYLAASSTPRSSLDIAALSSPPFSIRHIITLTESPLPSSFFSLHPHVRTSHLPLHDRRPPTVECLQLFLRLSVSLNAAGKGPILVHCQAGKGRTGTALAAYLCAYGFSLPPAPDMFRFPALAPAQALAALRAMRRKSVEPGQQEKAVKAFYARMAQEGAPFPPPPQVPFRPEDLQPSVEGTLDGADLVVLVGLPGSGKSTFARGLSQRGNWRVVSSDEDGKMSGLQSAASSFSPPPPSAGMRKKGSHLILDACNPSRSSRLSLLSLAHNARHPICVFFSLPSSLCLYRAQQRPDHPTLPPGPRVERAVKHFSSLLEKPTMGEGWKAVVEVRTEEAVREVVKKLGERECGLVKFPRTAHLFDLGAATEDDLLSSSTPHASSFANVSAPRLPLFPPSLSASTTLLITEKVDGANLAFSLSSSGQLLVQNRSHYLAVSPSLDGAGGKNVEREQFRRLGRWMVEKRDELVRLLGDDEGFLERWILYGEWMVATHSVHYTSLPAPFLAFDLYDRLTSSYLSRRLLAARLKAFAPSLLFVPVLYESPPLGVGRDELEKMVKGRSAFMGEETGEKEARREGVYLKLESEGRVLERFKVVRGDFIAGNEHWSKGPLRLNRVVERKSSL
ncbi:hypothetical protein JCM8547_000961 [Rhodosporidiobolus lusitaniae]